jgi:hypothetical protein
MKKILICYVKTADNVADIMTQMFPSGEKIGTLVERLLYAITSGVEESHTPRAGKGVSKVSLGLKPLNYCPAESSQQINNTNYKRKMGV